MLTKTRTTTQSAKTTKSGGCGCGSTSCCTTCGGLDNLERPRYFAGQLLTEAELNSEQVYVLAKNRLHNRYLHGWGVVCGLPVVCHDCEGWVKVKTGYAIDPCGNDIVVPKDHDVNLIDMIRKCKEARRKRRDCDPYQPGTSQSCADVEEHWCLTIAYDEIEARPITALRHDKCKSCGCNGNAKKHCGCGCHNETQTTSVARNSGSQTTGLCEPTRIRERYRFDVIEQPDCCESDLRELIAGVPVGVTRTSPWLAVLRQVLKCANLDDTLFMHIAKCVQSLAVFLAPRLGAKRLVALQPVFLGTKAGHVTITPAAQQDALCNLYQAVRDLYVQNPLNTRCQLAALLNQIDCPPPLARETGAAYALRAKAPAYNLLALIVQYAIDCVCQSLMPPCPPEACDERVILACITLKNDKIVSICDFACRRYAGSFPAVSYWLSAVPIVPILTEVIKFICCTDLLQAPKQAVPVKKALAAESTPLMRTAAAARAAAVEAEPIGMANSLADLIEAFDPTGDIRQAIFANDFELPQHYLSGLAESIGRMTMPNISNAVRTRLESDAVEMKTGVRRKTKAAQPAAAATVEELKVVKAELAALKAQLDEMKTPPVKKTVRKRGGK